MGHLADGLCGCHSDHQSSSALSRSFSGLSDHLNITDLNGILSMENFVNILVTNNDLEQVMKENCFQKALHMLVFE